MARKTGLVSPKAVISSTGLVLIQNFSQDLLTVTDEGTFRKDFIDYMRDPTSNDILEAGTGQRVALRWLDGRMKRSGSRRASTPYVHKRQAEPIGVLTKSGFSLYQNFILDLVRPDKNKRSGFKKDGIKIIRNPDNWNLHEVHTGVEFEVRLTQKFKENGI